MAWILLAMAMVLPVAMAQEHAHAADATPAAASTASGQAAAPASASPADAGAPDALAPAPPDSDIRARFDFTFDRVVAKLAGLVASLPLLLAALVIVLIAGWLGGFVSRRLHLLRLRTDNPYMNGLIRNVVRVLIVLSGVLLALDLLNATALVTAVLGSAGVVGLVLGFAFKDIAENYVAGILLSLRQPFSPGDLVVIDGNEGRVVALHSRSTVLMTLDGNELRLPNALVFKAIVLNYTRNPKRRFDFTVTIDPAQSIQRAQELALAQVATIDGLLTDPGPSWAVQEFGPAGIVLRFFGWVDQRRSDLGKVRSEAIRLVKAAYAQAGVESPRTVYHLRMAREAGDETSPRPHPEPAHSVGADTSVNRDIDEQLADAQHAADAGTNLLEPGPDAR
ncbi:mechanosensitive ion channel family protein [Luteimonas sp. M1R5S18]|uniref:Small-conductance mechanosensitive channel n=1 Tax=Luteimonas rhizosphaericola TaxID=3042024 RepID=A0ABT6JH40_9GAMM|nr:mechanosensitive ion channel family protein [Luteimonas rhizosphaericola]MDH5830002.1 mechanosensitive ion channel family protein [Luteimonas rhizosphaericola]